MPRKIRRFVGVLKIVGLRMRSSSASDARVIEQDELARPPRALRPEMRLEPALPVAVAERRRARRDGELLRHEVVVRDRVGGEMREVAEREGAQRLVARAVVDLQAHGPRMTVPAGGRVLLRDARVGGDRPVQKVVRERAQQLGDGHGQRAPANACTASPRKTCVPGVHACATAGATAMARTTSAAQRRTFREPRALGTAPRYRALSLAAHGAPEILELRLDHVVDRLARLAHYSAT